MLRNVECSNMYQVNDLLKLTGPVTLLPVYFYVGELSLNSDSITSSSSFPLVGAILPLTTLCLHPHLLGGFHHFPLYCDCQFYLTLTSYCLNLCISFSYFCFTCMSQNISDVHHQSCIVYVKYEFD